MNFQTLRLVPSRLPDSDFEHIFHELMPSTRNFTMTLHTLMTVRLAAGIMVLPKLGPFDTSPKTVVSTIHRATAALIAKIPALQDLVAQESLFVLITMLESGTPIPDHKDVASQLFERMEDHLRKRNELEKNPEPDFFARMEMEDTLRQVRFTYAMKEILKATESLATLQTSYTSTYIDRVADAAIHMQAAAFCPCKPGKSDTFPMTLANRKDYAARFARLFLEAYGNTCRNDH